MELSSEVKFDFSGAANLSANLQRAAEATARIRRDTHSINSNQHIIARRVLANNTTGTGSFDFGGPLAGHHAFNLNRPKAAGLSPAASDQMRNADRAALFGTAAMGSAFFYKSVGLANPAASQRLEDASADAAAVIGHRLVPAMERLTGLVRAFGDMLARNPGAAEAVGYGALGLTAVAAAGSIYQVAKFAGGGIRGAWNDAGRLMGRTGQAGGFMSRFAPAATEIAAEQAIATGVDRAMVNPRVTTPAAGRAGLGTRMASGMSRYGKAPVIAGVVASAVVMEGDYEQAKADYERSTTGYVVNAAGRSAAVMNGGWNPVQGSWMADAGAWMGRKLAGWVSGDPEGVERNWKAIQGMNEWWNPWYNKDADASSLNAAGRSASYNDVLGSVMQMRQEIAVGGVDPASRTADATEKSASTLDQILGAVTGGSGIVPATANAQGIIPTIGGAFGFLSPSEKSGG